jgi:hypothetical protein
MRLRRGLLVQADRAGRAVKWWFPGDYFGLHHKNTALEAWKRGQSEASLANWKRERRDDSPDPRA